MNNNYLIIKETLPSFRDENKLLLKPRGFNVLVRLYNKSYWKDAKIIIKITPPGWFKYYNDYKWDISSQGRKLEESLTNRLLNMILCNSSKKVDGFMWNDNINSRWDGILSDDKIGTIRRSIELEFKWEDAV